MRKYEIGDVVKLYTAENNTAEENSALYGYYIITGFPLNVHTNERMVSFQHLYKGSGGELYVENLDSFISKISIPNVKANYKYVKI